MADTESEPITNGANTAAEAAARPRRDAIRLTLRFRLTVLYGLCFLGAGAALLGITYALVAHDTRGQTKLVRAPTFRAFTDIAGTLEAAGGKLATPPGTVYGSGGQALLLGGAANRSRGPTKVTITYKGKALRMTPPQAQRFIRRQLSSADKSGQRTIRAVTRSANFAIFSERSRSLYSLLTWSGIALGGMAVLSILLGWLVAGRALRPLRTMNARALAITEESLHQRLGLDGRSDELGNLANTFDGLLARLERAFESQRRFVANASHELRTPLTLERTLVEVALADPNASAEALRYACERVLVSTEQQERLIEALLTLARSQAGTETGTEVDLAEVAGDLLLTRAGPLAAVELDADLQPAAVRADPALLERLIANLIDNAALHNGGDRRWIRVRTGDSEGRPVLVVANSGGTIPPDRVDELFEPFQRLDSERVAETPGLGLGLSIVKAIATAHGATVFARALDGGGLEVEVRFAAMAGKPPIGGSEPVASV